MFNKVIQFINETKIELTKVSWPSRKELIGSTIAVIFSTATLAVVMFVVDFILSHALSTLLNR